MKVTFLLPGIPWKPVGGYRVAYEYARRLARRGHEVTVVHPRRLPTGGRPRPLTLNGWLRQWAAGLRDRVATPTLDWPPLEDAEARFTPTLDPRHIPPADLVVATWWATVEAMVELPPDRGRPIYLVQSYESWGGDEGRVRATWHLPVHKVVIAKWLLETGLELGVPRDEMTHIPNAIDHELFRTLIPLEARPPRVALLVSGDPVKGGREAADVLVRARRLRNDLQATGFGVDRRPAWLPAWVEYHRRPSQERLVREIYNGAAVYLCSSRMEGWHLPPAEAMACGCAVVSTDIGGVRDYLTHGETGLLAPPGDSGALADHLVRLLNEPALRLRLARAGGERIRSFDWERSTDAFEALLRQGRD